jgi:aryl-alcohol dehydrogenase-like predicted oxidoreductase
MKFRTLGRTGLKVSEISFGTWAIGGDEHGSSHGPTNDAEAVAAIAKAVELGCNFFDTADVYGHGHSEEILGRGLREAGCLNEAIIAIKVGGNLTGEHAVLDFSEHFITTALEAGLKRLGRDYVDVFQLHNPPRQVIKDEQVYGVLEDLKKAGKIRTYGVSVHTVADGLACLKVGKPDTIQIVYNLYSLLQSENPAEVLFPLTQEQNIGIIAREPLANGFLTGKQRIDTNYDASDIRASWPSHYRSHKIRVAEALRFLEKPERNLAQAALRFVLDEEAVSTTLVGVKTVKQANENFAVSDLPPISKEEHVHINKVLFG